MLTNAVFFKTQQGFVETLDDAVHAAVDWEEVVWTLNPPARVGEVWVYPEALRTLHARISAAEADDSWPGASYEADVVSPEWRHCRSAVGWCWGGFGSVRTVPTQVRVRA